MMVCMKTFIVVLSFIVLTKCHENILNSALSFLKTKNDISFEDVVIFQGTRNDPTNATLCETAFNISFWNQRNVSVAFFQLRNNLRYNLDKLLHDSSRSLMIFPDILSLNKGSSFLPNISADSMRRNTFLIIQPSFASPIEIRSDLTKAIDGWSIDLRYDSQFYVLGGLDTASLLFEVYRICKDRPLSTKSLITFSNNKVLEMNKNFIWERRKNLNQCRLRLTYIEWPLLSEIPMNSSKNDSLTNNWNPNNLFRASQKTFHGPEMQLFKVLVKRLNFSITWVHSEDNKFGTRNSQTGEWNGMVGTLEKGKADMSLSTLSVTNIRGTAISYTDTVFTCQYKLFMKMPGPTPSWTTLPKVFNSRYWKVFWVCFTACSLSIVLLIRSSSKATKSLFYWLRNLVEYIVAGITATYSALLIQDMNLLYQYPKKFWRTNRMITFTICVFGMMNYSLYNAGLTSNLMSQRYSFPVSDISDFLDNSRYKLIIKSGTAAESLLSESVDESYKKVWSQVLNDNNLVSDVKDAENALKENSFNAFLWNSPLFEMIFDSYPCEVVSSRESYAFGSMAYGFNKKSPYINLFTYHIRQLVESGDVRKVIWKNKRQGQIDCKINSDYRPFNFGDIRLAFLISGCGFVIAVVYCVFECCINKLFYIGNVNKT